MKIKTDLLLATLICSLAASPAHAQFGPRPGGMAGPPRGPRLSGSTAKLFGDNAAFSATLEMQTKDNSGGDAMTMPGKIAFAEGKSRFEMDMTQMKGGKMPAEAGAQMKSMGMDRMTVISRPDKKLAYVIYPGLQAYVETALPESEGAEPASEFKVETTELAKEAVDGHPCVKHKTVVTNNKGDKHEAVVWNATDLKNFPIKIEQTQQGAIVTMSFRDVKLDKPESGVFDPPADLKRYESMQTMMQEVMMKRFGGGQGFRPPNR